MDTANTANRVLNLLALGDTVVTGKFLLIAIVINTKGGSSNTLKVYDNPAGTALIKLTLDTTTSVGRIEYGIPLFEGLHIVIATGTAPDVTVIYRDMA